MYLRQTTRNEQQNTNVIKVKKFLNDKNRETTTRKRQHQHKKRGKETDILKATLTLKK